MYEKFKDTKEFAKTVKESLDEDDRSGGIFEGGVQAAMKLLSLFFEDVHKHPYFTFFKVHLEALARRSRRRARPNTP